MFVQFNNVQNETVHHKIYPVVYTCRKGVEDGFSLDRSRPNLLVFQGVFAYVERPLCRNFDIVEPCSSSCLHSSMSDHIRRKGTLQNIFYYLGTESVVEGKTVKA